MVSHKPSLICDICDSALPSQTHTFGLHEEFGLLTARRIRNIRSALSWRPASAGRRRCVATVVMGTIAFPCPICLGISYLGKVR
jgi:hypothetical protein